MRTHLGIELSPIDCRIVEIAPTKGWRAGSEETRVRSFSVSPRPNGETRAQLARLRGREAAVVAWGLRGDHRQAIVNADRYDAMRREAINSLRFAGVDTRGVLTDIAPAGPRPTQRGRRPVVMALASRTDIAAAVRPLVAAGIKIRSVVTPAAALCSVARLRRGRGALGGIEAYVALEETATCIALVREQVLVAARELPWGYVHEHEPFGERVPRDKVAIRLADELVDFFSAAGIDSSVVNGVCICGALPELRTMTAPIMERLDIEVEPLDSMFGIDVEHLPAGGAEFRERAVELRLAWAAAADWKAPLNLLRDRQRRATAAVFARAAVVAGVGAGVSLGWGVQQTAWLEAAVQPSSAVRRAPVAPPEIRLPKAVGMSTIPVVRREPTAPEPPPPIMHEPVMTTASVAEQTLSLPEALPVAVERPVEPEPDPAPKRDTIPVKRAPQPAPIQQDDVELGSILFGPERKLAMIDGRIVEAGDEVSGARVIEIGPTSVTLRDRAGRVRKLSLGKKRR